MHTYTRTPKTWFSVQDVAYNNRSTLYTKYKNVAKLWDHFHWHVLRTRPFEPFLRLSVLQLLYFVARVACGAIKRRQEVLNTPSKLFVIKYQPWRDGVLLIHVMFVVCQRTSALLIRSMPLRTSREAPVVDYFLKR